MTTQVSSGCNACNIKKLQLELPAFTHFTDTSFKYFSVDGSRGQIYKHRFISVAGGLGTERHEETNASSSKLTIAASVVRSTTKSLEMAAKGAAWRPT